MLLAHWIGTVRKCPRKARLSLGPGTLTSATLSWDITGSETGAGNFAATGTFNYASQTQAVTFDTVSDLPLRTSTSWGRVAIAGERLRYWHIRAQRLHRADDPIGLFPVVGHDEHRCGQQRDPRL